MIRVDDRFGGERTQRKSSILIRSQPGYMSSVYIIAIEVSLDHLVEEVFVSVPHCSYSLISPFP
jgi:hypothetical protein